MICEFGPPRIIVVGHGYNIYTDLLDGRLVPDELLGNGPCRLPTGDVRLWTVYSGQGNRY